MYINYDVSIEQNFLSVLLTGKLILEEAWQKCLVSKRLAFPEVYSLKKKEIPQSHTADQTTLPW